MRPCGMTSIVRARDRLLAEKAHDVGVQVVGGHRMLLVGERVDGVDARLDSGGALEVEIGRCVGHLGRELVEELPVLPREEAPDAAHVHGVLLGGMRLQHAPGPKPMAIEAGAHVGFHHRERIVLKAARDSANRRTTSRTGARHAARCRPCGGPHANQWGPAKCRVRACT